MERRGCTKGGCREDVKERVEECKGVGRVKIKGGMEDSR